MKKMLLLLMIALLIPCNALAYYTSYGMRTDAPNAIYATLNQRMATRTGPGTKYSEPGTFFSKGDVIKLISQTTDSNGTKWVQAEIEVDGRLMRVYTGMKRFKDADVNALCHEERLNIVATLDSDITPTYGPNWYYAEYDFTLRKGSQVLVLDAENGYDMCEFHIKDKIYRAWLPDCGLISR